MSFGPLSVAFDPPTPPTWNIEWYGKQVDQLDTMHHAKVTLTGAGADGLAVWDVLDSAPDSCETT